MPWRSFKLTSSPLLAALSGVLLARSLPPFHQALLAWVALAPLFLLARGRRPLECAGLGLVTGVVCGAVHVGYHPDWQAVYSGMIPFLWLALLLALVLVATSHGATSGLRWITGTAAVAVSLEWATCLLPLPLTLALTQSRSGWILPLASVTGAWGLSFLLWWTNAALADGLLQRRISRPVVLAAAGMLLALFLLPRGAPGAGERVRVAAIQDHAAGDAAGIAPTPPDAELPDRETLTRAAVRKGARLVVWSERCLGSAFSPNNPGDPTRKLARELRTAIIPGYMAQEGRRSFNCAAWIGSDGELRGVHHKMHPFMDEARTVTPGRRARAVETEWGRAGMEICFDTCYPAVTRELVRDGARLIAVPTIDPPVARAVLHFLHGAVTPLRAAEHAVPMVRADPNGLSQVVDRDGRIVAEAPLWKAQAVLGEVRLGDGRGTLFTRFGDWLPAACVALSALAWLRRKSGHKNLKGSVTLRRKPV